MRDWRIRKADHDQLPAYIKRDKIEHFILSDAVREYEFEDKVFSKKRQLADFGKVWDAVAVNTDRKPDAFEKVWPFTAVISALGKGVKGRMTAARLFMRANEGKYCSAVWYDIDNDVRDSIYDEGVDADTQLLVMANVNVNSGGMKPGKLRDVFLKHADVPKLILATGADPHNYMDHLLGRETVPYEIDCGLCLGVLRPPVHRQGDYVPPKRTVQL